MRFYLDTEFNSFGGALLSLGMVAQDGSNLYLVLPAADIEAIDIDPWVAEHVVPILFDLPDGTSVITAPVAEWGSIVSGFIYRQEAPPQIFADWPSDIADLCNLFITGPGEAVTMKHQTHLTILRHLDVYPTTLKGAVQHNALWDAMALRRWVMEHGN